MRPDIDDEGRDTEVKQDDDEKISNNHAHDNNDEKQDNDENRGNDERQCRICLDGSPESEQELGRLIRPCLCRGSISLVHVKCLQRWRNTSASNSAFFSCPQCLYRYRFARTKALGLATNPGVLGVFSTILFVLITLISSWITTYFMSAFETTSTGYHDGFLWIHSPLEVATDLVRAALRIMQDDDVAGILESVKSRTRGSVAPDVPAQPSNIKYFLQRFVLGLPLVGATSLVHMMLSIPLFGPLHWIARYRGNRRRNNDSRDITALIIVALLTVGAVRALYHVYRFTQSMAKKLLLRAEDAILEV
ncbi:hypothetical protein C8J56DRAFT_918812 [Mycena floridula]|nr:hypothetical protein C8J56DRAFT_918812 [Mycena floridula]